MSGREVRQVYVSEGGLRGGQAKREPGEAHTHPLQPATKGPSRMRQGGYDAIPKAPIEEEQWDDHFRSNNGPLMNSMVEMELESIPLAGNNSITTRITLHPTCMQPSPPWWLDDPPTMKNQITSCGLPKKKVRMNAMLDAMLEEDTQTQKCFRPLSGRRSWDACLV